MADKIKVNSAGWINLTNDDQERIKSILSATGLFKGSMSITPDQTARAGAAQLGGVGAQPAGICGIGCDIGEAAAVAACAALSGPAMPICIAAAHAAGEICRENC